MSDAPTVFKAFRQFNRPDAPDALIRTRSRAHGGALRHFEGPGLPNRLAVALIEARALPFKEILESFEFFERVRRRLRAPVVADLCCGHGLTGTLFAVFERSVESVVLLDRRRPESFGRMLAAVADVAPWAADKVRYVEGRVERAAENLPAGASVLGVHACGVRTDRCIDTAIAVGGSVAVLPCCYARTALDGPRSLRDELGVEVAADVHRTYRLRAAGYSVAWTRIPPSITVMNRIVVGWREAGGAPAGW